MHVSDIIRVTDVTRALSSRAWAWAALLSEARTASNDGRRHSRSDRERFNAQVDLLGALGELFLLPTVMRAPDSAGPLAYMRDHLCRETGGGGVKGPDLSFVDGANGVLWEMDVKTFDCSPNKRFLAINDNKHRSLAGHCSHYFCIIVRPPRARLRQDQDDVLAQVDHQAEIARLALNLDAFCQRVRHGLAQATWEQKRQLIEWLVARVVVTDGEVEIRYVIPTTPAAEVDRFCHLRSDYRAPVLPPQGPSPHHHALRQAGRQLPRCRPTR
jgi:hypothetical protein